MGRQQFALLLLCCVTLTAGCSFLAPNPDSYASSYEYTVGIDANATLENTTVRVPLPQRGGRTVVNASAVAPNGSVGRSVDASVVETAYGPMLELTADRFAVESRYYRVVERDGTGRREEISSEQYDPADPDHQRVDHRTIGVTVTVAGEYPLDTRTPVGDEPLLYGDDTVTRRPADCRFPYEAAEACFDYGGPVYLAYDSPGNASVDGYVAVTGRNEWFAGGWTGNGYTDGVRFSALGPQTGWVSGSGYTETGRGRYPSPAR